MKTKLSVLAALLLALSLGLFGCSSGGSESQEEEQAPAAQEQEQAPAADAVDDQWADVSPELKQIGEEMSSLADDFCALVDQAEAAGSADAVMDQLNEMQGRFDSLSAQLDAYDSEGASDLDKAYMDQVVGPASMKMLDALGKLLELA